MSEGELASIRQRFPHGAHPLRIEHGEFSLKDYRRFLADNADGLATFKQRQQTAFEDERERWAAAGQLDFASEADVATAAPDAEMNLPDGARWLSASVPGSVWQVAVSEGQRVQAGEVLLVIESMKMEFNLLAPSTGTVHKLLCSQGGPVAAGQHVLAWLDDPVA